MVQWINILLFSAVLFIMLGIAFLVGSKSRRRIMQDRLGRIAEDGKGETGYEGDLIRNVRYSDIPYLERVFNMGKFGTEIRHFLTCCRSEQQPLAGVHDGLASLQVALAAQESLRTGLPVSVEAAPDSELEDDGSLKGHVE